MKNEEAREILNILKEYERAYQYSKEEVVGALDMAIQALEQQRWIPVSEGVPECHICEDGYVEPSKAVLVQLNNGSMETSRYWKGKTEPWIDLTYPTTLSVVAWRSLPQSYGEEQDGKNNTDND